MYYFKENKHMVALTYMFKYYGHNATYPTRLLDYK